MPYYEYRCAGCRRKVAIYLKTREQSPVCPECGSVSLQRVFSTFSVRGTDRAMYEDILTDSRLVKGMLANDPRSLAEWNRRMSHGEKAAPEYQEMVEKLERGQSPDVPSEAGVEASPEQED